MRASHSGCECNTAASEGESEVSSATRPRASREARRITAFA